MPIGIVQFFLPVKGYGYIRIPETREEFYVQSKYLPLGMILQKGMQVHFEIEENRHGLEAINVKQI